MKSATKFVISITLICIAVFLYIINPIIILAFLIIPAFIYLTILRKRHMTENKKQKTEFDKKINKILKNTKKKY
ncbi:MAG: hypothetical protein KAJ54_02440 [Candidatus Aenigmarchaeota archaeon]|nr:hypothetical protein [Candidatus Aenigmarchaeota archaeon]